MPTTIPCAVTPVMELFHSVSEIGSQYMLFVFVRHQHSFFKLGRSPHVFNPWFLADFLYRFVAKVLHFERHSEEMVVVKHIAYICADGSFYKGLVYAFVERARIPRT